ncbi:hypothetical protein ACH2OB_004727, partial [Escherichia coli]
CPLTDFGGKRVFLVILFTSLSGSLVSRIPGAVQARKQHPERWGKHLRNWDYISEVYLNPEKEGA